MRIIYSQLQMAMVFDPTQVTKLHVRNSDFFSNKNRFKEFKDDVSEKARYGEITDIELECFGYGHFSKEKVLDCFFSYIRGVLTTCKHIKMLKISIGGFDVPQNKFFQKICYDIVKNTKESIKCLWFHTAHISKCSMEDFESITGLINELSHINFESISLQFSEWRFVRRQPYLVEIEESFRKLLENARFAKINNQHFRLEMSAWYYQPQYAKQLLRFKVSKEEAMKLFGVKEKDFAALEEEDKDLHRMIVAFEEGEYDQDNLFPLKAEEFHAKMESLIRGLLEMMDHVKQFQIDFRHWSDILKMDKLKKRLDNVTKKDTYEKSIVSKRMGLEDKEGETELRMTFVM